MGNVKPLIEKDSTLNNGIGSSTSALGTLQFYFHSGGGEYSVELKIVPGYTSLIISHNDLDEMGLNYQTFHKTIGRPEKEYKKKSGNQELSTLPCLSKVWLSFSVSTEKHSPKFRPSFGRNTNVRYRIGKN